MSSRGTLRRTLSTLVAAALLAVGLLVVIPSWWAGAATQTFSYTGAVQSFTVPAGVSSIQVVADGGNGRAVEGTDALGARVTATLTVTPGQQLAIYVGGAGAEGAGGFNGGGVGAGGGGGATDVRPIGGAFADRLLVAGGGGGSALLDSPGGAGGIPDGVAGADGVNGGCT